MCWDLTLGAYKVEFTHKVKHLKRTPIKTLHEPPAYLRNVKDYYDIKGQPHRLIAIKSVEIVNKCYDPWGGMGLSHQKWVCLDSVSFSWFQLVSVALFTRAAKRLMFPASALEMAFRIECKSVHIVNRSDIHGVSGVGQHMTGNDLHRLILDKWGQSFDVQIRRVQGRVFIQIMWRFLEQASFPLTEDEYLEQLNGIANYINAWGCDDQIRAFIQQTSERPRLGRAVSIPVELGERASEWILGDR